MSELYKKDAGPLVSSEEATRCPLSGCAKTAIQCVQVSEPVVLTPTASVGTATTACQGSPTVSCETSPDGTHCTVTLTQKVCVTIPVQYGVTVTKGEPSIACDGVSCTR